MIQDSSVNQRKNKYFFNNHILVNRYAMISKDLHLKTTNMFDREREGIVKFMICCNITKSTKESHLKSKIMIQRSHETDERKNTSTVMNVPASSFSVQFRKQVRIKVLDR